MIRRLLALTLVLASATAVADDRETAGIHFQAAQAAERRRDFQGAIDEYEKAYKLAPHPTVLFNLANLHEKLDHFRAAFDLFKRYLDGSPDADDRDVVKLRMEKLRDRASHVTVKFPPNATLVVDGQARGTIPTSLDLPAGVHRVHVEQGPDFTPDQEIVVEFGEPLSPSFDLKAAPPVTPSGRPPPTLTIGAGLGLHGGIASAWDTSVGLSGSLRLGGTIALSRRLRVVIDLAGTLGPSVEDDRVGINFELGPKERYVMFVPRGGISYEVWRRSRLHLDAFGEAALVLGYHSIAFGMDQVSRQGIHGIGAGGGIAFFGASERSPRQNYYLSAGYFVLPTAVGDNTGYRSQGTVDTGGFELGIGYSILLGPLATAPPPAVRGQGGDWQVRR